MTHKNIPEIRLLNQQLLKPTFSDPKKLVSWMGAIQAQDNSMVKWAVGIRLKSGTIKAVEKALHDGEILRTHVMRPTWHLVTAEDIRWMLKLSAPRLKPIYDSYAKGAGITISEELISKSNNLLEKTLCGNKSLTKQELTTHYEREGFPADTHYMNRFLGCAELEGIVCSGEVKGRQHTYALLEERVPPTPELTKDESIARLARSYFRSHAPATLQDFIWWSGLLVTDARQAISLIESELTSEQWNGQTWYIHSSSRICGKASDSLCLLPPYDEYLISYKDRTDVLPKEYYPKAFTNNGLFFPVVAHKGQIIGNWSKEIKKGSMQLEYSYFEETTCIDAVLREQAKLKYASFLGIE